MTLSRKVKVIRATSAPAAFEVGAMPADLLFRANEYAEAIFSGRSGSQPFYLDARVPALPSLEDYGCPGLSQVMEAHGNIFRIKDKMHVQ